jgi:uncharacterized iron-regulated protein
MSQQIQQESAKPSFEILHEELTGLFSYLQERMRGSKIVTSVVREETSSLDDQLMDELMKFFQEGVEQINSDIQELSQHYAQRVSAEEAYNQSYSVAQTIQQFLAQNKSVFMKSQGK